ncbi:MAG: ATP-dependent DNA helicase, partial [Aquificaceae bacterium]
AFEKGGTKIIQAPTGTGKTFGYLIPIIEKGQKAIISTGTKMLQEQLRRDIETLRAYASYILGKEISYLILKGKSNYLCLDKYYSEKRIDLDEYINSHWDGDYEFVDVAPEVWAELCVEDDYCDWHYRNICKYRRECYYWGKIKDLEKNVQILVVNHTLLALREFENPKERVLVIDEAHELDKYITRTLRNYLSLDILRVEILGKIRQILPEANVYVEEFFIENFEKLFKEEAEEIPLESLYPYAEDFERRVLFPIESLYQKVKEKLAQDLRDFLRNTLFVSLSLKDYLYKLGLIDWQSYLNLKSHYQEISKEEEGLLKKIKSYDLLSKSVVRIKNFHSLMKEQRADLGFLVGRRWSKKLNTFNYWLEVFPIFPAGHLDFNSYKALIITSATVDPKDLKQTLGIEGDYYELSHTFDYSRINFIICDTNPKREEWSAALRYSYKYLRTLHDKVLVLLTNKEQKKFFEGEEGLAFQGEGGLSRLVQNLREGNIKALAGFDSLWFGIDVPGKKGMLMAKLPFENPNDPINFHRIRFLESIGEDPFEYQKRKALIKFRQGLGRMMRTKEDGGTVILCDNRIYRFVEFLKVLQELGVQVQRGW